VIVTTGVLSPPEESLSSESSFEPLPEPDVPDDAPDVPDVEPPLELVPGVLVPVLDVPPVPTEPSPPFHESLTELLEPLELLLDDGLYGSGVEPLPPSSTAEAVWGRVRANATKSIAAVRAS